MGKAASHSPKHQVTRTVHWSLEEVREFSTTQIIDKLRHFGVHFEKDEFQQDVKQYHAGCKLVETWMTKSPLTAQGFDEDFVWMACLILWERLVPDLVNIEQLEDIIRPCG